MKNKDFFYLQYDKINWRNQEETKINSYINNCIIQNVISRHTGNDVAIFDLGFGIGFFFKMLLLHFKERYKKIVIEGCEPSTINYKYFESHIGKDFPKEIKGFKETFQAIRTETRFDFITAIYVFPHFLSEDLEEVVRKIYLMLKDSGKFILVLADEKYLENKLRTEKDLYIEEHKIAYKRKEYKEVLHYSDIPKIGKVIDYNREEVYYLDLFENNGFKLDKKETLDDNGFVCTLFVFGK
jgi:hypothetical protein